MTLFTVHDTLSNNFKTRLIDNDGQIINQWIMARSPASSAYLLQDSTLLYPTSVTNPPFQVAASGGKITKYAWDGSILWTYYYYDTDYIQHHDIEPLPNGNVLLLCYEIKTLQDGIANGFQDLTGEVWPEKIVEIEPSGSNSGNVVWEWHLWDHLVQDIDSTLNNFGSISDNPGRLDANAIAVPGMGSHGYSGDWLHANSIFYNPVLDQIAISCRRSCEFYVIDHSTSTEEASSSSGGIYSQGGDFLYRWGNPQMYRRGTESDKQLFHQHCVNWISGGYPGAGNFILFNNGTVGSGGPGFSSVLEIVPPYSEFGDYLLDESLAYGPEIPSWNYDDDGSFASGLQSSAFRIENGNTIITITNGGDIFEVDSEDQIVWTYQNEFGSNITRAVKYGMNYLSPLLGDVNQDSVVNVIDIVYVVNMVLGEIDITTNSDLNADSLTNVVDIILLVNIILEQD